MGYYVRIFKSDAYIKKENLDICYKLMCDLNKMDRLKEGGSWSGGKKVESWFSWMDPNYPETCKDTYEILAQLGFDCSYDDKGDLHIEFYDSKTGQEELFFKAIKQYVVGTIDWIGEDDDIYSFVGLDKPTLKVSG